MYFRFGLVMVSLPITAATFGQGQPFEFLSSYLAADSFSFK